jgi:hypothetical protein
MATYKLNTPYHCPFCKKTFVVVIGAGRFKSYLPIEIITGNEIYDSVYDKDKGHKSHLLNCLKLQENWENIKEKLDKQLNQKLKIK